ncbi:MAG: SsrA-binding protein SmpB [Bacteroidetes bacterium]|nr:SsrA-binding protein SmpB [Bacteroidota bacterium]
MAEKKRDIKIIATNRKARHEYEIMDKLEAGIVLMGSEVKSLREGRVTLQDCHARIENNEVILYHMHIPEYKQANLNNHPEYRPRKLLIHRTQIRKLQKQVEEKGMTLIPLSLYFNEKNLVKVELAVARGKKLYDKRESIAKRDENRRLQREYGRRH